MGVFVEAWKDGEMKDETGNMMQEQIDRDGLSEGRITQLSNSLVKLYQLVVTGWCCCVLVYTCCVCDMSVVGSLATSGILLFRDLAPALKEDVCDCLDVRDPPGIQVYVTSVWM